VTTGWVTGGKRIRTLLSLPAEPAATLDEAIEALKRDPTHPVRVRADEELTVEVRAVDSRQCRSDQLRMHFANSAAGKGRPARNSTP